MKKRIIAMFLACFIGVTAVFGTAVKTKAFVVTATVSAIEIICSILIASGVVMTTDYLVNDLGVFDDAIAEQQLYWLSQEQYIREYTEEGGVLKPVEAPSKEDGGTLTEDMDAIQAQIDATGKIDLKSAPVANVTSALKRAINMIYQGGGILPNDALLNDTVSSFFQATKNNSYFLPFSECPYYYLSLSSDGSYSFVQSSKGVPYYGNNSITGVYYPAGTTVNMLSGTFYGGKISVKRINKKTYESVITSDYNTYVLKYGNYYVTDSGNTYVHNFNMDSFCANSMIAGQYASAWTGSSVLVPDIPDGYDDLPRLINPDALSGDNFIPGTNLWERLISGGAYDIPIGLDITDEDRYLYPFELTKIRQLLGELTGTLEGAKENVGYGEGAIAGEAGQTIAGTADKVIADTLEQAQAGAGEAEGEGEAGGEASKEEAEKYTADWTGLFPFCIPFDLIDMLKAMQSNRVAPVIDIPVKFHFGNAVNYDHTFTVDFDDYSEFIEIFRVLQIVGFSVGLILITRQIIKG